MSLPELRQGGGFLCWWPEAGKPSTRPPFLPGEGGLILILPLELLQGLGSPPPVAAVAEEAATRWAAGACLPDCFRHCCGIRNMQLALRILSFHFPPGRILGLWVNLTAYVGFPSCISFF